jgi:hypothetical protein
MPSNAKKLPIWKRAWIRVGFTPMVVMFMVKGGKLIPIVTCYFICIEQRDGSCC